MQQCIEKLMKANLIEREIPFPRTHNLVQLAGLLKPALPAGKLFFDSLARLLWPTVIPGRWLSMRMPGKP
ncbi:HEPN domain protein [Allomeiothermus silvanus DSM 9946]|uniref:HEPN domain protein n=2 Tax=Allomeiothermus silvanus TaxID=52022 RepID=D7BAL8_ALLS1|nr:HEPN domain protein [Allomeiothermus silvanus DSM 9946]